MKEQIIEVLKKRSSRHFEGDGVYSQFEYLPEISFEDCADEIIKIFEFEELCNPDIGEAGMNEAVIAQNYISIEEYNDAMNHIGELEEQISDMKEDLRLSRQDRSGEYGW
jgi:hypothetical protein